MREQLYITIQSANRTYRVKPMEESLGKREFFWYVPLSQVDDYLRAGATRVIGVDGQIPMKPLQLNAALDDGFNNNRIVVTMDDDLIKCGVIFNDESNKRKTHWVSINELIDVFTEKLIKSKYYVAGCSGTTNSFWLPFEDRNYGMLTGQFLVHKPSDIRFDPNAGVVEDLEYSLAHHMVQGGVVKVGRYILHMHMVGREKDRLKGGYQGLRTDHNLAVAVEYIRRKYPTIKFADCPPGVETYPSQKINWNKIRKTEEP